MFDETFDFVNWKDNISELTCSSYIASHKERAFKGSSADKHVDDYCVIDLETTSYFVKSAKIVEISAIKVRDNRVIAEYSALVNPKCHIPEKATAVNHITDMMVADAPGLNEVIDEFLDFNGDDVIIGYNNASFDMSLLYDEIFELKNEYFSNDYLDMLHAVRRSLPELEKKNLESVCRYYGFDISGEHRALKDCYLTKACYDKMFENFGERAFIRTSHSDSSGYHATYRTVQYTDESLALKELQEYLRLILEDNQISQDEVESLSCWVEEHRELSGNYPFDVAFRALDNVLEDGRITEEELTSLKTIFTELVDPVKSQSNHEEIHTLNGKHVCLTGEFDYGMKSEVEKLIQEAGGIADSSVKKSTDYLVVGAQGSEAWKAGNYGGKIQRAMELRTKGQNIQIIEEKDFIPNIQYLLEHSEC